MPAQPQPTKLTMAPTGRVVHAESGEPYRLADVIGLLPWRQQGGSDRPETFDPLTHMPLHQYVVRGECDAKAYEVLLFAINKHPASYRGYFRGYQYPNRYLELDGYRYWATAIGPTQMLNRCKLDSVEPPRRVDEGARPICWQEWQADASYLPQGSGWSEEYRRKNPDLFDPAITPPCAHGAIATGDRVKHLASRRYGTVIESGPESAAARVRWDGGKTSRVGWKGLRTRCCLPREPFGPPPEVAEPSGEVAASAPPARNRGGGGDQRELWGGELLPRRRGRGEHRVDGADRHTPGSGESDRSMKSTRICGRQGGHPS